MRKCPHCGSWAFNWDDFFEYWFCWDCGYKLYSKGKSE